MYWLSNHNVWLLTWSWAIVTGTTKLTPDKTTIAMGLQCWPAQIRFSQSPPGFSHVALREDSSQNQITVNLSASPLPFKCSEWVWNRNPLWEELTATITTDPNNTIHQSSKQRQSEKGLVNFTKLFYSLKCWLGASCINLISMLKD